MFTCQCVIMNSLTLGLTRIVNSTSVFTAASQSQSGLHSYILTIWCIWLHSKSVYLIHWVVMATAAFCSIAHWPLWDVRCSFWLSARACGESGDSIARSPFGFMFSSPLFFALVSMLYVYTLQTTASQTDSFMCRQTSRHILQICFRKNSQTRLVFSFRLRSLNSFQSLLSVVSELSVWEDVDQNCRSLCHPKRLSVH